MGFFRRGAISRVFVTTLPEIAAMRHLVTAALLVVGVIHLLPLAGVLGAERLNQLYGIDDANQIGVYDPNSASRSARRWGVVEVLNEVEAMWAYY